MDQMRPVLQRHLKKRIYAFGLDLTVINFFKLLLYSVYLEYVRTYFFQFPRSLRDSLESNLQKLDTPVTILLFVTYFMLSYYLASGKTIGKFVFGLRVVVNATKNKMSLSQSLRRSFGSLLCYMSLGLFYVFNFLRNDGKGVADFFSKTQTVSDDEFDQITRSLYPIDQSHQLIQLPTNTYDEDLVA